MFIVKLLSNFLNRLNWYHLAIALGLLFYLPAIISPLLNSDVGYYSDIYPNKVDVIDLMKHYLAKEAKPFYAFNEVLYSNLGIPHNVTILVGALCFIYSSIKWIDFLTPNLFWIYKLVLFLLHFYNPFIYFENNWNGQFFCHGLLSIVFYYNLMTIVKYKDSASSLKRSLFIYILPILSVWYGLMFFMPTFFGFMVLAMAIVLKKHLEDPFSTIVSVLKYSINFLLVLFVAGIFYVITIKTAWAILGVNYEYMKQAQPWRFLGLTFLERLGLFNFYYNQSYNIFGLLLATILLFRRNNMVSYFVYVLVCLAYFMCYFSFLVLDLSSSQILNFTSYSLSFSILALFLNNINYKNLNKIMAISGLALLVFFYIVMLGVYSSYYKYQATIKNYLLPHIAQTIEQISGKQDNKIILLTKKNMLMKYKRPFNRFIRSIFPYHSSFDCFRGSHFGYPNIIFEPNIIDKPDYVDKKADEALSKRHIYPHPNSIIFYKDSFYIVN